MIEPEGWWEATNYVDERYEGPEEWDLGFFDADPYMIVGKCYNCAGYVERHEASSDFNLHKDCYEPYRQYVMRGEFY